MSQTRIQFSSIGERWTLELIGGVPESDVEVVNDIVSVVRDTAGRVVEMLIDFAAPPAEVVASAVEAFGPEVEAVLRSNPINDIDTVVGGSAALARPSEGVMPARRASINISIIKGEPGVPVPRADHSFDVVLESPAGDAAAVVDRDVDASRIRVSIEAEAVPEGAWLRVADGETGTILALGEVQSTDSASGASVAFALDIPTQALHFSATDDPLTEPGTRRERRRRWARETELLAEAKRLRHPKESTQLLRRAVEIYDAIGDEDGSRRCQDRLRRLETGRRARWVLFPLVAVVAVVAAAVFLVSGSSPDVPVGSTNPGPVDIVFDDVLRAGVAIVGPVERKAGEIITLSVQSKLTIEGGYTFESDCIEAARSGNSGAGGDGPMAAQTYTPVLTYLGDSIESDRVLGSFTVERRSVIEYPDEDSCRAGIRNENGDLVVETELWYAPYEVSVQLPSDLRPGYWSVALRYKGDTPDVADEDRLTVLIEN